MASPLSLQAFGSGTNGQMFLGELREGSTGPITIMVCRKWDVTSVNGRYMSTDYIASDEKGGVMHCTAHYFFDKLEEGGVYLVKGFAVQPTNQYRVLKESPFVIGLHGSTTVKRVEDNVDRFECYPFLLTAFEELQPTENKYFIDVIGYVTEVGARSVKASGAHTVEFTDERNRQVRVTQWGQLGDIMIQKKSENPPVYSLILTSMSAKFYLAQRRHPLFVQLIVDYAHRFKRHTRVAVFQVVNQAILFRNEAEITSIRTKNGWYIFTCSGSKCRKGLTREDGYFICKVCKSKVDYPRTRFRIQADITDGTMSTVVVLFDEIIEQLVKRTAKSLVEEQLQDTSVDAPILPSALESLIGTKHTFEIKSHTYYRFGEYESFNCTKIVGPTLYGASNDVCPKVQPLCATSTDPLKRFAPALHPSPKHARKLRKFCVEVSDDDTNGVAPDHMSLNGVIDDIENDEKGSP